MNGSPLIRLTDVGKDYPKVDTSGRRMRTLRDLLLGRAVRDYFRALDAVSFDMRAGESLGVIGDNGAGKSTLLKMIAGVIRPTRGTIEVNGRVGALLELGSGFHGEYSGLANIDLAAALMGLSAKQIAAKRDEIIAFADIGEHIHDPLKHYSSGMVVRLGFAVATALRPEVLITDEVLAVGDASFQKKCIAWMETYLAEGGTLLLCSHSMYHVQKLCRHAVWIHQGRVERYGDAFDVTQAYLAYNEHKSSAQAKPAEAASTVSPGSDVYALTGFRLEDASGAAVSRLETGSGLVVAGVLHSPDGRPPNVLVGFVRADGTPVYGVSSDMDAQTLRRNGAGAFAFRLVFPSLPLLPGQYTVRGHALDPEGVRLFDTFESGLHVTGASRELGLVRFEHRWA